MKKPIEVCFCTSSRSERSLIAPLLKKLDADPRYNLYVHHLPTDLLQSMNFTYQLIRGCNAVGFKTNVPQRFDIAFCPFDRPEMLGAAMIFFLNNIPVAQIHAGDMSLEGALDDIIRHQITLCSDFQFCTGVQSYLRTLTLLGTVRKSHDFCREIGFIHFDDIEPDYSKVPKGPFDLVVYNAPTRKPDRIPFELDDIEDLLDKPTIWIEPNEDPGRDLILARMQTLQADGIIKIQGTLPRAQFLGLLEKSDVCIGNSSCFFLELPYYKKDDYHRSFYHIGVRNKGREVPRDAVPGGTDKIMKLMDEWFA